MSRILMIVAVVLFAVGFVLTLASTDQKLREDLLWLGLACFAGAHVL